MNRIFLGFILVLLGSCKNTGSQEHDISNFVSANCELHDSAPIKFDWASNQGQTRLLLTADFWGNRDGHTTREELSALSNKLRLFADDSFRCFRRDLINALGSAESNLAPFGVDNLLSKQILGFGGSALAMAMRADLEWGNGNGTLESDEVDSALNFYAPLSEVFPGEFSALRGLSARPVTVYSKQKSERASLVAKILNDAMLRSSIAAPWFNTQVSYHAPTWHQFPVLQHVATSKLVMEILLRKLNFTWPDGPMFMAVHDVGKIAERSWVEIQSDGQIGFNLGHHAEVGKDFLSKEGWSEGAFLIAHHEAIRKSDLEEIGKISTDRRTIQKLLLVFAADNLGKGTTPALEQQLRDAILPNLAVLYERYDLDSRVLASVWQETRSLKNH